MTTTQSEVLLAPAMARARTLSLALLLVVGCSKAAPVVRAPEAQFLRASPIVEHSPPSVDLATSADLAEGLDGEEQHADDALLSAPLSEPEEDPGPTSGREDSARRDANPSTPAGVIAEANAMALQGPEAAGFLNAVMTYTFQPGGIYKVLAAPDSLTDLVLEPGEELMGDPAAGDTLRWRLGVGTSQVAGVPQKHVYLKPTRAGLTTTLALNTNRRTYFLRLESLERDSMVAVQWSYPQSQTLAPAAAATVGGKPAPAPTPRTADVAALNFDYEIEVTEGRPAWKPVAVYDDGAKTYIRFDPSMLHGESPALYVIERDEMQVVNYRVKGDLYIADRIFRVAELRLGQDDQDIVRLRNRRRERTSSPPPRPSSSPASPRRPATPR